MDPSRVLRTLKCGAVTANGAATRLGYPRADGLFMEIWRTLEQDGYIRRGELTPQGVRASEHESVLMDVRASQSRPGVPRQRGVTVFVWFCKHCNARWETSLSNVMCPGAR